MRARRPHEAGVDPELRQQVDRADGVDRDDQRILPRRHCFEPPLGYWARRTGAAGHGEQGDDADGCCKRPHAKRGVVAGAADAFQAP